MNRHSQRKKKLATQDDVDALFMALVCRIDAIGEVLSGINYGAKAAKSLELGTETLDYYREKIAARRKRK